MNTTYFFKAVITLNTYLLLFLNNTLAQGVGYNKDLSKIEIPSTKIKEQVVIHKGFTLMYSEKHEQARWVAYELNSNLNYGSVSRTNQFTKDKNVKTETASGDDYINSGYDRGHLVPAADMSYSYSTMLESFYYSNISPQLPKFNRGIWKDLEYQVRNWGSKNKLYVVTGPVLSDNLRTIGPNKVSVPNYFFKALLGISESDTLGIAFLLPNSNLHDEISRYTITIDSLESLLEIDFFYQLPDRLEERVEKTSCYKCWNWESSNNASVKSVNIVTSIQCRGMTQAGSRCKRKTKNPNGLCFQHTNQH